MHREWVKFHFMASEWIKYDEKRQTWQNYEIPFNACIFVFDGKWKTINLFEWVWPLVGWLHMSNIIATFVCRQRVVRFSVNWKIKCLVIYPNFSIHNFWLDLKWFHRNKHGQVCKKTTNSNQKSILELDVEHTVVKRVIHYFGRGCLFSTLVAVMTFTWRTPFNFQMNIDPICVYAFIRNEHNISVEWWFRDSMLNQRRMHWDGWSLVAVLDGSILTKRPMPFI